MAELPPIDRARYSAPEGGRWFWTKDALMLAHAQAPGFLVAWDKAEGEQRKIWGLFPSPLDFFRALLRNPSDRRWAYEVVLDGPVRAYMDIEFYTPEPDAAHRRLRVLLAYYRARILEEFGLVADVFVACSTRPEHGSFKNSYHVVFANLVFPSNHAGPIKSLFEVTAEHGPLWFCEKKARPVIDQGVYTHHRCMRLPLCSKRGVVAPFYRISASPCDDALDFPCPCEDIDALLPFVISAPLPGPHVCLVSVPCPCTRGLSDPLPEGSRGGAAACPSTRSPLPEHPLALGSLPFDLAAVHAMLAARGDHATRVSKVSVLGRVHHLHCDQRHRGRRCLHDPALFHASNNCSLTLVREAGHFRVDYRCYGTACAAVPPLTLGCVPSVEQARACDIFARPPDETYAEPELRDLPAERAIAIRSPCGTGKTKAFVRHIERYSREADISIVFIAHRRALSRKAVETFPAINGCSWTYYKDVAGPINIREHPQLVIQYESIGRLEGFDTDSRKLVLVLDEFNSLCHQMHSGFGRPVVSQQCFYDLVQCSTRLIAMDGYLDQDRLDILERYLGQPVHLIHNRFESRRHHTFEITTDPTGARLFILDCVARGEHVINPCMDKSVAEGIYCQAVARFGPSRRVLLFTRDNPWDGADVNATWSDADLVIYTSTIDCGISFEVGGHFHRCVCLFDNSIGPTHETAVQMLSRSRDTRHFLLCVTGKRFVPQSEDKDTILAENQDIAAQFDSEFFGIRSLRQNRARDWATSNPYLSTFVVTELVRRRSRNDLEGSLLALLRQDGARIAPGYRRFAAPGVPQLPVGDPRGAVHAPGRTVQEVLDSLRAQYAFGGFDLADLDSLRRYDHPAKLSAYRNLCMLARLGPDFASALAQKRRDIAKIAAGLSLCRASGAFAPSVVSRAEVLAGIEGVCYDLEANCAAADLVEHVVGSPDPFALPPRTEEDLAARLRCETLRAGARDKEMLCLTPEGKRGFVDCFTRWVLCRPDAHTPRSMPGTGPLRLSKALYLLNHVLRTMYDMEYRRLPNPRMRAGRRIHVYAPLESQDFPRAVAECPPGKPTVPAWAPGPVRDLAEADVLQVQGPVVQPAFEFAVRQGVNFCVHDMPSITHAHLFPPPPSKRQRRA